MIDMTDLTARDNPAATPFPILWRRVELLRARSWRHRIAQWLGIMAESFF